MVFSWIYLTGLVAGSIIRAYYGRRHSFDSIRTYVREGVAIPIFMGLWGGSQILAVLYTQTTWFGFADYPVPGWLGWAGMVVFTAGLWLLYRSHADLGYNWSPSLAVKKEQALVTDGVFRYIRHPMYAAHMLWSIGQALLIPNFIAGFSAVLAFIPLYLCRVPKEEAMMVEHFGDAYADYMKETGRIIPRMHMRRS